MVRIEFTKFHGTANDFIIIDEASTPSFDLENHALVKRMCDRRTGIGADGLMLILPSEREDIDFEMKYYNSDGRPSSMCGNGGRCITLAAASRSIFFQRARFLFDGDVYMANYDVADNWVSLKMQDVESVSKEENAYVLDTGSPHYVTFVKNLQSVDVQKEGSEIRYSEKYKEEGINVNFVHYEQEVLHVLTYERGVEDETFSCGTGVVASAIALAEKEKFSDGFHLVSIQTKGGNLEVSFEKSGGKYQHIFLKGPAVKVFSGVYIE